MAKPPTKGPVNGKGTINDTQHATAKHAAGRPSYPKPYGKKK